MLAPSACPSHLSGLKVLVVEDDADCRECVIESLAVEGAVVSSASSGNRAFSTFVQERPDVIVSDIWMSDGDGYDFIQRIRKLSPSDGGMVPAIAMSCINARERALAAGFQLFVPKPFSPFTLIETIAALAQVAVRTSTGCQRSPRTA